MILSLSLCQWSLMGIRLPHFFISAGDFDLEILAKADYSLNRAFVH